MPEKLNSEAEKELRRVAEDALWSSITINKLETLMGGPSKGQLMLRVESHDMDSTNAFAGMALEKFLKEGFIATSVAASENGATAWFKPVDINIAV